MALQNDTKELLKGAYKTFIGAVCSLLIVSLTDTPYKLYSADWFRHLVFACVTVTLVNESRYWLAWSKNSNGNGVKKDETKNP